MCGVCSSFPDLWQTTICHVRVHTGHEEKVVTSCENLVRFTAIEALVFVFVVCVYLLTMRTIREVN